METLGDYLRETREKRGLTPEDVYGKTRIQPHLLAALEEDRFHAFPAEPYVRAFLRSYCGVLGISGDEVMARYLRETHQVQEATDEPEQLEERARAARQMPAWLATAGFWGATAALLIAVVALVWGRGRTSADETAAGISSW